MFIYSVKFICGVQKAQDRQCTSVRRGAYATEINIHNFNPDEAVIEKRVLLLIHDDKPVGREPNKVPAKRFDKIALPQDTATDG
jgi:hypothetical protein